jgi:hypothetical protein
MSPTNSSKPSPISGPADMALPQYGFGADVCFDNLVGTNQFLFRVYTPRRPTSEGSDTSDKPSFTAQRFQDDPPSSKRMKRKPSPGTYADVAQHMDWTTKSSSPYVSTSFSFAWAIWEAVRRYRVDMKHDVEIAVIDASAVADQAVTALDLLRTGNTKERHASHWKWYRFALESQSVLVYGSIPSEAVFASIPILPLLERLPSYLLLPDTTYKLSPFDRLGWDVTQKKPSFRQFCQDSSEKFLRMPVEPRLRDAASSSVRLSLQFLRTWLQEISAKDMSSARDTVASLAMVIARWPGQWWVKEHGEIPELLEAMVQVVVEEIRDAQRAQKIVDTAKAQRIVDQLKRLSIDCENEISLRKRLLRSDPQSPPTSSTSLPSPPVLISTEQNIYSNRATASCWLTGFLFGTFITLCLFSHHRRELLLVA